MASFAHLAKRRSSPAEKFLRNVADAGMARILPTPGNHNPQNSGIPPRIGDRSRRHEPFASIARADALTRVNQFSWMDREVDKRKPFDEAASRYEAGKKDAVNWRHKKGGTNDGFSHPRMYAGHDSHLRCNLDAPLITKIGE